MPDFTIDTYKLLLEALLSKGYSFIPLVQYLKDSPLQCVILRHDVDAKKLNSLATARLENELGIRGTYYFRMVPESFDEGVIRQIYDLGHEVGYHYEDLSMVAARGVGNETQDARRRTQGRSHVHEDPLLGEPAAPQRGVRGGLKQSESESGSEEELHRTQGRRHNPEDPLLGGVGLGFFHKAHSSNELSDALVAEAINSFRENLETLRRLVPIETICMHGSPLSRWDNRLLWNYYDYKDFGISGEPYFDLDFNEVLYLTDTGRRWDGEAVSIRDKAIGRERRKGGEGEWENGREEEKVRLEDEYRLRHHATRLTPHASRLMTIPLFRSTFDIINAARSNSLPDKIMITVHPQRWTNKPLPWVKELVWQNVKNVGKWMVVRRKA